MFKKRNNTKKEKQYKIQKKLLFTEVAVKITHCLLFLLIAFFAKKNVRHE